MGFIMPNNATISVIVDAILDSQCIWFDENYSLSDNEEENAQIRQELGEQLADYVHEVYEKKYDEQIDWEPFEYVSNRKYDNFYATYNCIKMYMYQCENSPEWITSEMAYYLSNLCIKVADKQFGKIDPEFFIKGAIFWGYNEEMIENFHFQKIADADKEDEEEDEE